MARTVNDARMESRAARARLPARREPYWRTIAEGRHIGYRRGSRGGKWVARLYRRGLGYRFETLGLADDVIDADGCDVLDFGQAQELARSWFEAASKNNRSASTYRVCDTIGDYLEHVASSGRSGDDMRYRIDAYILPEFGDVLVRDLTSKDIRRWHARLAASPVRLRTARGRPQNFRPGPEGPEAIRKRRHSANKVLTILKAALNLAFQDGVVESDSAWRRVKPFRGVDQPRIRFPGDDDEIRRLVNACDPDFRDLVRGALFTGARYAEVAGLTVRDFDRVAGTLYVAPGKTGKPRYVVLTREAVGFLGAITVGRPGDDPIFLRRDGEAWKKSHQRRPMMLACERARIDPLISFHVLRHWYAAMMVRAGVPITIVAENLGHADPKITMRHYGHLAPGHRIEILNRLVPDLEIASLSNVNVARLAGA